ncbi:MAG: alpha/beta hydrolase [Cyclobacteriaceae bacterium]|nr:alpha/beta hydrolase [Cyclobacteriaceae bacterium]MCH8515329.1 alpha/beta hydrolase [Cyclobacteriaceae bacterium]
MIKKILGALILLLTVFFIVFLMGPRPEPLNLGEPLSLQFDDTDALEDFNQQLNENEAPIKNDNESRIIWQDDTLRTKTPYSILYLHGFSSSWGEGEPVHRALADSLGANLYLSRLRAHGRDDVNAFESLTSTGLWQSTKEALEIAKQLGDSVIVIGTSTGGLLGMGLAAQDPLISHLLLYSPLIDFAVSESVLFDYPWSTNIIRSVVGSDYIEFPSESDEHEQFWYTKYHINGLPALKTVVNALAREEVYKKIDCPVLLLYYYKNEEEQDKVVSVAAMLQMFPLLASSDKEKYALPETGNHVIGSEFRSNDWESVLEKSHEFLRVRVPY